MRKVAMSLALGLLFVGAISCAEEDDESGDEAALEDGEGCFDEEDESFTPAGEGKACECSTGADAEKICLTSGEFTACLCDGGW